LLPGLGVHHLPQRSFRFRVKTLGKLVEHVADLVPFMKSCS
jgi:hypothetical protein